jgi:hypothetical protein
LAKFALGDRVRKIGSKEIHVIEEVRESAGAETCYWTALHGDIPTRVFVKESDLEVADAGGNDSKSSSDSPLC